MLDLKFEKSASQTSATAKSLKPDETYQSSFHDQQLFLSYSRLASSNERYHRQRSLVSKQQSWVFISFESRHPESYPPNPAVSSFRLSLLLVHLAMYSAYYYLVLLSLSLSLYCFTTVGLAFGRGSGWSGVYHMRERDREKLHSCLRLASRRSRTRMTSAFRVFHSPSE